MPAAKFPLSIEQGTSFSRLLTFKDSDGNKVNARNVIFIATSNASAEEIFKMVESGKNPDNVKEEIISGIISKGIFKPELINRFDSVIVFKPLGPEELQKIAKLQLTKLQKRMMQKGINFELTDTIIHFVAEKGSDKVFGARPMNRFIQDNLESRVAELILKNDAMGGKNILCVPKDGDYEKAVCEID